MFKKGDRVVVAAEATGDGTAHRGVVEEVGFFLGREFIDVRYDIATEYASGAVLMNTRLVTPEDAARKERSRIGRTQKHMAFRCDLDLIDWLATKPNKGGLINSLLRQAMELEKASVDCAVMPADPSDSLT